MSAPAFGDVTAVSSNSTHNGLHQLDRQIEELNDELSDLELEHDDIGMKMARLEDEIAELEEKRAAVDRRVDDDGAFPDPPFGTPLTMPVWPTGDPS